MTLAGVGEKPLHQNFMDYLPFFVAENLTQSVLAEGAPWNYLISREQNWPKKLPKPERRKAMLQPDAIWNVYTACRGASPTQLISKNNPCAGLRGLVADYDAVSDVDTVCKYLDQMPAKLRPTFIEISLGDKIRLIWTFEREILTPSTEFCIEVIRHFFEKMGVPALLAGYDPVGSEKPTERWTNGGEWYEVEGAKPLAWDYCFGMVCDVSKKSRLFEQSQISLATIADEVNTRFPGRWTSDFKLDNVGVRFWDEAADNPTGCQIKLDGMLCFTGKVPFVKWEAIFGKPWCEEQRVINLGKAGENIYFDGKNYWETQANRWVTVMRPDIFVRLTGRGLSDVKAKGETQSDVTRVLDYIQQGNRIEGAAPFINYQPGLLELDGFRFLNVANLQTVQPKPGPTGIPDQDFPFISNFIRGLFARPELGPLDHFLTWLKFGHIAYLRHERHVGQAIFLCGPRNNGKTLLCERIVVPLLGGRKADPMDYFTGQTQFNDELFHAGVLTINDQDAPRNDGERSKMLMRLKSFVVNPSHSYHPKFCSKVTVYWTGRIFITLNDDPSSVGVLPEISQNTEDKMMFFASQPYANQWRSQKETEALILAELPYFSHWLINDYEPPAAVLSSAYRGGVVSYYDPVILELSRQQLYAFNLEELLRAWFKTAAYWVDDGNDEWIGTPTDLLTDIGLWEPLRTVAREWTQSKVAKAMTALAKQKTGGIEFHGETGREFKITRSKV